MEKDIHNFTPKLRLTEYFANENDITFDEETQPLLKSKGTFHFQKVNFIGCQRLANLKLFRKLYKFKAVNTLKSMNHQV